VLLGRPIRPASKILNSKSTIRGTISRISVTGSTLGSSAATIEMMT
jgi:hypothetical protein